MWGGCGAWLAEAERPNSKCSFFRQEVSYLGHIILAGVCLFLATTNPCVLSQEQEGKVRPIAYTSHGLRTAECNVTNYSSIKLEFLALKWAMTEKFREYLLGQKCIVYTDNNPVSHLVSAKLGATEQHWAA